MDDAWLAVMATLFLLGAGLIIGIAVERSGWQAETVERGLALYCPTDGDWAWKGKCDNE